MNVVNKLPKKKQEEFIQEQLYIEDCYYIPSHEAQPEKEDEEQVERGVLVIDLM